MAFNQVAKYYQGYVSSVGQSGGIIAGLWGLLVRGSTHVSGACTDHSGNVYVTDAQKNIILKITEGGTISVIAGASGVSGNNGNATVTAANARFNYPTGICCDRNGDLYICDTHNHQIRRISNNKVSLVAGASVPATGTADGVGDLARFNTPYDIDIDASGVLYIADTMNHAIRRIRGSVVSTLAGLKGTSGHAPVWAQMTTSVGIPGTSARFNSPYSVAVNQNGYVFVGDTENHVIKRIDQAGNVRIFSGSGVRGTTIARAKTCQYQDLKFSDIDKSDDLYIVDFDEPGASRLMRIDEEGTPGVVVDFSTLPGGPYLVSVACNPASHLIVVESDYTLIEYSSSSSSSSHSSSSSSSQSSESSSSQSSESSSSQSSSSSSSSQSSESSSSSSSQSSSSSSSQSSDSSSSSSSQSSESSSSSSSQSSDSS